jgi:hypothetical protein
LLAWHVANALDSDNDTLTYSLLTAPAAMTINPATGFVFWQTGAGDAGPRNVTIQVADGKGGFATQSFTLNVIQVMPGMIQGTVFNDLNAG